MPKRIGILTGGGDAPGLNAVIRAVVKYGVGQKQWEVVGIEDAFNGLLERPYRIQNLDPVACKGLLPRGGTILGTTNRGDPFSWTLDGKEPVDRSSEVAEAVEDLGLEGLIIVGGDGTQKIGLQLMARRGVPVVGVPKTIDNDLSATDYTFGFMSAVEVATDALDRLHTTAEAHDRVMLLEVMGRDAGWIALYAGLAGGADCIVIPEIPYDVERICNKIEARRNVGRHFTLVVVAEGAVPDASAGDDAHRQNKERAADALARAISKRLPVETRVTILGHLQRGGSPVPFDRILGTRMGIAAVELIEANRWGEMVCLQNGEITGAPIAEAVATYRLVEPKSSLIATARATGIEFGAAANDD